MCLHADSPLAILSGTGTPGPQMAEKLTLQGESSRENTRKLIIGHHLPSRARRRISGQIRSPADSLPAVSGARPGADASAREAPQTLSPWTSPAPLRRAREEFIGTLGPECPQVRGSSSVEETALKEPGGARLDRRTSSVSWIPSRSRSQNPGVGSDRHPSTTRRPVGIARKSAA